jgi:hypothetical protein
MQQTIFSFFLKNSIGKDNLSFLKIIHLHLHVGSKEDKCRPVPAHRLQRVSANPGWKEVRH